MPRTVSIVGLLALLILGPGFLLPTQDVYEPIRSSGEWGEVRLNARVAELSQRKSKTFRHSTALTIEVDPSHYECIISPVSSAIVLEDGPVSEILKSKPQRYDPPQQISFYSHFTSEKPESFRVNFVFDFGPCDLPEKLEVAHTFEPKTRRLFLWFIIHDAVMSV